jgi:glycosyltransferase involved in cell wall biosynthesis
MTTEVCVVIPTRNEEKSLEILLKSLNRQTYKNFGVLVIDGGSTDGTARIAKKYGARVIKEYGKYRSAANARNIGVKKSGSDIIAVLDADNEVNEDFIRKALEKFGNGVAAVRCSSLLKKDSFLRKVVSSSFEHKKSVFTPTPVFWKRKYLLETGGWDSSLGFGEDRIFERNIEKFVRGKKLRIEYAPDSKVYSYLPGSLREIMNQQRWYGRTILHFLRENRNIREYKSLIKLGYPLAVVGLIAILIRFYCWEAIFAVSLVPMLAMLYRMLKALAKSAYGIFLPFVDIFSGFFFLVGFIEQVFRKGARGRD